MFVGLEDWVAPCECWGWNLGELEMGVGAGGMGTFRCILGLTSESLHHHFLNFASKWKSSVEI